jgi:hypothetical protein
MASSFAVNFDYRCPFARNAHDHLVTALLDGADYEVQFLGFSLTQSSREEGAPSAFTDPTCHSELIAVAAGIVVRETMPDKFLLAHRSLFEIRHGEGADLRDPEVIRRALHRIDVDADHVFAEIDRGWPIDTLREEHEFAVNEHHAFGVPTFIAGTEAVFVRLMNRAQGDVDLAHRTVGQVVNLLENHPEINEFKHTTVPY